MPDYKNGKIYKLVGYGKTYYGSTTQSLNQRKGGHKRHLDCKSREIFKLGDDVDIVLVESYPCNNKEELHQRERYYIENNECINKVIPMRTEKEYREDNKEKIKKYREDNKEKNKEWRETNKDKLKEWFKQYREDNKEKYKEWIETNKDKIKEKYKEKITCECGSILTRNKLSRHKQSKKHITFINNKNDFK